MVSEGPPRIETLAARIRAALDRGDSPVRALRDAMERDGGEVSRIELIAAFRIATSTRLADASAIGAWHVFGERLTDDDLDAELVEAMRRHV